MPETTFKSSYFSYTADYSTRQYNKKLHTDTTDRTIVPNFFVGTSSVSGVKLPNWQSVVRAGGNATTTLTGSKYEASWSWATAGEEWTRTDGNGYECFGAEYFGHPNYPNILATQPAPPGSVVTSVTNRCIRKFLARAESIRSSIEAGQDFGEYKETLHGITNPLSELRRHVLGYFPRVKRLKGLYKDAKSLTKALADTYLEWTFGWKPLASDIADAIVGAQNRSRFGDRAAIRVSATDNYQVAKPSTTNMSSFGGLGNIQMTSRITGEYSVCMYGMIRTGAVKGAISRNQDLQLDLPHFIPTIWDLIPYSFIVDYFVNVGDIIRSLSVVDSQFIWGGQDTVTKYINEFTDIIIADGSQPPYMTKSFSYARGGNARFTLKNVSRSVLVPSGLIPRVQFTVPLSDKPWINMGAILTSHIAGLVPLF